LGAYAVNNRIFDALAMVAFGVVGFVLERLKYPLPPFILGFVLSNTFELNLRRGLQVDHGNFLGLFSHPIATVFFVIAILSLLFSIKRLYSMKKS
jgi:putative tricarboxylic transport membrane protein